MTALAPDTEVWMLEGDYVFFLQDTHGLPLSVTVNRILSPQKDNRVWVISWNKYIMAAFRKGWKLAKIRSKINEGLTDASDVDRREIKILQERLNQELDKLEALGGDDH